MNNVQQSLQENLEEIKKNLPEEFHADLEKQISDSGDATGTQLSGDAAVAAVKAELEANPEVDNTVAAELTDLAPVAAVEPSEAEQKHEMESQLSATKAEVEAENSNNAE